MNIGIIVYSQTGNTLLVSHKLQEKLTLLGHTVNIEKLTPIGVITPETKVVEFEHLPNIGTYDALIFAAPVHGFSLSLAMKAYIGQISNIGDKKIACFMTHHFPFKWMGGNSGISQMVKALGAKDAVVIKSGVINWSSKKRESTIGELVEEFCGAF